MHIFLRYLSPYFQIINTGHWEWKQNVKETLVQHPSFLAHKNNIVEHCSNTCLEWVYPAISSDVKLEAIYWEGEQCIADVYIPGEQMRTKSSALTEYWSHHCERVWNMPVHVIVCHSWGVRNTTNTVEPPITDTLNSGPCPLKRTTVNVPTAIPIDVIHLQLPNSGKPPNSGQWTILAHWTTLS